MKQYINELVENNKNAANSINASKNKADSVKKTIEKAFDQVRTIIREKQLQFMKMIDSTFTKQM